MRGQLAPVVLGASWPIPACLAWVSQTVCCQELEAALTRSFPSSACRLRRAPWPCVQCAARMSAECAASPPLLVRGSRSRRPCALLPTHPLPAAAACPPSRHAPQNHRSSMHTHTKAQEQLQRRGGEREATSNLHQGENQFFGTANAIERRPCPQLGVPTNGLIGPNVPALLFGRTQGRVRISRLAAGLGARRPTARSQPLGLVSSCPPFSSPAPVWHGRGAGVVRERARAGLGAGLCRRAWCRCLSACCPRAMHARVRAVEIVVWTRRSWRFRRGALWHLVLARPWYTEGQRELGETERGVHVRPQAGMAWESGHQQVASG